MDHMSMSTMSMTATATGATPSSTGSGMSMSMGGGSSCKISMLWNWYTVDACFLARSWHVKSKGIFALSCIGVVALVIALEFLRRLAKEYDRRIVASYARSLAPARSSNSSDAGKTPATTAAPAHAPACAALPAHRFRPNVPQQAIRALLHMLQFAVAYFVMLLAMYYNGYIIICIFIGAYLGYFIFGWESFGVGQGGGDRMEENVTVCCG